MDASTDKTAADTQADASKEEVNEEETAKETIKTKAKKAESTTAPKQSIYDRYDERVNEKLKDYPKLASKYEFLKEVWSETFPNAVNEKNRRYEQRRKIAKLAREEQE